MAYIYTIAHPLTNTVVYIGATKNFESRKAAHYTKTNNRDFYEWAKCLKEDCLLPRIEIIDECESDSLMFFETYWINQFVAWGFNPFNINQKLKQALDRKKYHKGKRHVSKYAVIKAGDIVYRNSRTEAEAFRMGLSAYLKSKEYKLYAISTKVNNVYKITISESPRILKGGYVKKIKPIKPFIVKQAKFKYHFDLFKIGESITIDKKKHISFGNALGDFNRRNNTNICFSYTKTDETVICTRVLEKDKKKQSIALCDLLGNIEGVYNSVPEIRDLGYVLSTVHACLKGKIKKHRGKTFKYLTTND